jgi:hypothetical protein
MTTQTAWTGPNVVGYSKDPNTKQIDSTEGWGGMDSILRAYSVGRRAIDVGGGESDSNRAYLLHHYQIDCQVIDPFKRSKAHNRWVRAQAKRRPVDVCFSISVLNVIDTPEARVKHLRLCRRLVKPLGQVFFKVWPGDGSGKGAVRSSGYQSNAPLECYLEEIQTVFGESHTHLDSKNQLIRCLRDID